LIKVLDYHSDGWSLGLNLRTNEKGDFPLSIMYPRYAIKFVLFHLMTDPKFKGSEE
jgi:hypothetical protein